MNEGQKKQQFSSIPATAISVIMHNLMGSELHSIYFASSNTKCFLPFEGVIFHFMC
jgi:hypothetical protein